MESRWESLATLARTRTLAKHQRQAPILTLVGIILPVGIDSLSPPRTERQKKRRQERTSHAQGKGDHTPPPRPSQTSLLRTCPCSESLTSMTCCSRLRRSVHLRNGKRPPCLEFKDAADLRVPASGGLKLTASIVQDYVSQYTRLRNGNQRECASASTVIKFPFLWVRNMEIESSTRKR